MSLLLSEEFLLSVARCFWWFFSCFVSLGLQIWCGRRRSSFSSLTIVHVSLYQFVTTATAWVSFWPLSMCLPLKTLSHFPLNVGFLSLLTLGDCSTLHNFASDSEVSSSHHLIKIKVLQTFAIVNNLSVRCFERFLGRTKPRQSEAEQSPVIWSCTILPGSHLKACRWLIIELDPIQRRNLGRRHSGSVYWTNLSVLVPLHKAPVARQCS